MMKADIVRGMSGDARSEIWGDPGAGTSADVEGGDKDDNEDGEGGEEMKREFGIGNGLNTDLIGRGIGKTIAGNGVGGSRRLAGTVLSSPGMLSLPGAPPVPGVAGPLSARHSSQIEEEGEGDDELLPAMADDDYSAQLSWQSQSKDNLKVLMDNFSPAQYDRFEAYRRHALPKQAVRKVIQHTLGQQISQPIAQVIAGFSKVFVGEIVEKARQVQIRRGESGPLSPDHLREAYRAYQQETGRVGAARPMKGKKLFVR